MTQNSSILLLDRRASQAELPDTPQTSDVSASSRVWILILVYFVEDDAAPCGLQQLLQILVRFAILGKDASRCDETLHRSDVHLVQHSVEIISY